MYDDESRRLLGSTEKIMNLIMSATGGEKVWNRVGGSIQFIGGFLMVTGDKKAVKEVGDLVQALEEFH